VTGDEERRQLEGVRQPWEQRDDESGLAFDAFKTFLDLGLTRTVSAAYQAKTGNKKGKKAAGTWFEWAKRFEWYSRAAEFDRYVAAIEAREEEQAFAERRRTWLERRADVQDEAWELRSLLISRAKEILALPVVQVIETRSEDDDGKKVTITRIINPVRASYSEATRAIEAADKLGRLAVGMATERIISKSAAAELAETLADARAAFRDARDLYADAETVEETARNVAAAYALEPAQLLEGYDEASPLASSSVS
jgi:hypothetical protein